MNDPETLDPNKTVTRLPPSFQKKKKNQQKRGIFLAHKILLKYSQTEIRLKMTLAVTIIMVSTAKMQMNREKIYITGD